MIQFNCHMHFFSDHNGVDFFVLKKFRKLPSAARFFPKRF